MRHSSKRILAAVNAAVEALERRQLLSVSLVGNVLTVTGTGGDDVINLKLSATDSSQLRVVDNGVTTDFNVADIDHVVVNAFAGNDRVVVGQRNGAFSTPVDVRGGSGADTLIGGLGADTLRGNGGNDLIIGRGSADDVLVGGVGNDILIGNAGNGSISGGDGRDLLTAGSGSQVLDGGAGNDTLVGGSGSDTLTGGPGADLFAGVTSSDTVTDKTGRDIEIDA